MGVYVSRASKLGVVGSTVWNAVDDFVLALLLSAADVGERIHDEDRVTTVGFFFLTAAVCTSYRESKC